MGPDIPITSQHPSDKIEQAMALALEMACGSDYDDGKLAMIAA